MSIDKLILQFDKALRSIFVSPTADRINPAKDIPDAELTSEQKNQIVSLMRVNHSGEVCAQALYHGQALTSKNEAVKKILNKSADEEKDHLAWTEDRIKELGGRVSFLNPIWYVSSFTIGAIAGALGDKWNLGFVSETERQVEAHINHHLDKLPPEDAKSRAILHQMKIDEIHHGETARQHGGVDLPLPVQFVMKATAKIMTTSTRVI